MISLANHVYEDPETTAPDAPPPPYSEPPPYRPPLALHRGPEKSAADDVMRELPHAVGPEKSILSTLLQEPAAFMPVALSEGVTAEFFYLPAHSTLFGFLVELHQKGVEIELVSLVQNLLDRGMLDSVGGPPTLTDIYTYSPSPGHFLAHLGHVRDKFTLRSLIHLSNLNIAGAYDSPDDVPAILADAESRLRDIRAGASADGCTRKALSSFVVSQTDTLGMSWAEIDALRPPIIIESFIRRGEVLLLGAESKSRKSWLVQDAGFAVAAGIPWLADEDGENGFPTAKSRVHVLDLELNSSEMRFRFAKARGNRFADSSALAAAVTDNIVSYSFDGMNALEIISRLPEVQATVRPGELVILDCFYRLVPDGNETIQVADAFETIKRFAAETQAGVIIVDHFRKAADNKARNRFAGSFVKQAGPSTLVAIEAGNDGMLALNVDARTFHGCPIVHARFNSETYAFDRVPEAEVEGAKQGAKQAECEGWLVTMWKSRALDCSVSAADGEGRFGITRPAATKRLRKLVERGWLKEKCHGPGQKIEWKLSDDGLVIVQTALGLKP